MSIFGNLVTDNALERAVKRALQGWLPTYIPEVARQDGTGDVTQPKSYEVTREVVTAWPEQALPAVVIEVGGSLTVVRKGNEYRAVYGLSVGAIIAGQTRDRTREIAGVYALAITAALVQHGDLDGFASGVTWTGTDYDLIDVDRGRTLMAAVMSFDVSVDGVLDVAAGPSGPTPDPETDPPLAGLPDYGEAVEVDATITLQPLGVPYS